MDISRKISRRDLIKTVSAASVAMTFPAVVSAQPQDKRQLKVGLIGCGGRGTGAAFQALNADPNTVLHALADVFPNRITNTINKVTTRFAERCAVPAERQFVGLEGYQKVIETCDVVLLAAPPAFRPKHLRAAVEAGKHVFAEKPMAVDMPGVASVIETAKLAKSKGVSIQHGFSWRFAPGTRAAYQKVANGDIGKILSIHGTYMAAPPKVILPPSARTEAMSDIHWQTLNWINFDWLSGAPLLEQSIHTVDKVAWAMQDQAPIAAYGSGGRSREDDGGNIFDHYSITYEYPDGVLAHLDARQWNRSFQQVSDRVIGAKGVMIGPNRPVIMGESNRWRFQAEAGTEQDMYQVCHNEFFAAIRSGDLIATGEYMARSTALAILGREAAHSGQRITWDDLWQSEKRLGPSEVKWEDSFEPNPLPRPGVYKFS